MSGVWMDNKYVYLASVVARHLSGRSVALVAQGRSGLPGYAEPTSTAVHSRPLQHYTSPHCTPCTSPLRLIVDSRAPC